MNKTLTLVVISLLLSLLLFSCNYTQSRKIQPLAKNGILDLRDWNIKQNGPVNLDGEWSFYWNQLLKPETLNRVSAPKKTGNFIVPGIWNDYKFEGKLLGGNGYATFHLVILLKPTNEHFALKALEAANAYKMWVNSKEILSNGIVGRGLETMKPQYTPMVAVVHAEKGRIEILVQVSNFVHRKGGIWNSYKFGLIEDIHKIKNGYLALEYIMFGSIFIMGLYHLSLFSLRKKELSALYFGIFCLIVALRILLTGERLMHIYLPWLDWSLFYKLELLTFYLGAPTFILFLGSILPEINSFVQRLATFPSLIASVIVIIFDTIIASKTLQFYQLYIVIYCFIPLFLLILAVTRKKEGALIILTGSFILFATLIYDILESILAYQSINLAPFGLFLFILAQSFMLSVRFSNSFTEVEELSKELEQKVKDRTRGLNEANKELNRAMIKLKETQSQLVQSQKMEAMGTFAGGIAHDFNTLIGTILGYTRVMAKDIPEDSVVQEDLKSIAKVAAQAKTLVKQIRDFSTQKKLDKKPVNIITTIQNSLDFVRTLLPATIIIEQEYDFDKLIINAHEDQITQVIVNLCTNSASFMSGNQQRLKLSIMKADHKKDLFQFQNAANCKYMKLTLSDNGKGIAPEIIEKVFDPFFTTKDIGEGTGLGLSIVHNIVQNHDGFISLESKLNEGTIFKIYFPILEDN